MQVHPDLKDVFIPPTFKKVYSLNDNKCYELEEQSEQGVVQKWIPVHSIPKEKVNQLTDNIDAKKAVFKAKYCKQLNGVWFYDALVQSSEPMVDPIASISGFFGNVFSEIKNSFTSCFVDTSAFSFSAKEPKEQLPPSPQIQETVKPKPIDKKNNHELDIPFNIGKCEFASYQDAYKNPDGTSREPTKFEENAGVMDRIGAYGGIEHVNPAATHIFFEKDPKNPTDKNNYINRTETPASDIQTAAAAYSTDAYATTTPELYESLDFAYIDSESPVKKEDQEREHIQKEILANLNKQKEARIVRFREESPVINPRPLLTPKTFSRNENAKTAIHNSLTISKNPKHKQWKK